MPRSAIWSGEREIPPRVGALLIVTAATQSMANEIAKLINPFLLHFPLSANEELPTFAFPYSPAETERGQAFEFRLNHVMAVDDPMEPFSLETFEIGHA